MAQARDNGSQAFLAMGVPNDRSPSTSLVAFQSKLVEKLAVNENLQRLHVSICEVAQLNDEEDMGECFLVGLSYIVEEDSDEQNEATDVLLKTLGGPNAEAWVTSTGPIPLAPSYGWKRGTFECGLNNVDNICDRLRQYGLAIVLSEANKTTNYHPLHDNHSNDDENSKVAKLEDSRVELHYQTKKMLEEHVALLERTVEQHHPHIKLGESAFGFKEYTHRGPGRFEVLFAPSSPIYHILQEGLEPSWIKAVCHYLKSERSHLRLNISCVYSRPGAIDQDWHTDGDHYGSITVAGDPSEHKPYALCIFVPLIPLTNETGYTRFWPKSHLFPNLLGLARAADVLQATIDGVSLQPGDFVMYDYTTWHKGMGNSTKDVERPIIQFLYSCDWYKERQNYGSRSVFEATTSAD